MAATPTDVFKESNKALNVLSEIRDNMLKILQGVSDATGNSLRAEPDLVMLQKARQSLAEMLDRLKASAAWIERNQNALENIKIPKSVDTTEDLKDALDKQAALRKVTNPRFPGLYAEMIIDCRE